MDILKVKINNQWVSIPSIVGPKGDTGNTGATGATPNISIGTVTTGAPGSSASASMTGTPENPVLNMTIPQGDKGDPGDVASVAGISPVSGDIPKQSIMDMIYPVGSIYMSVNSTSPGTLFGGTWEQLKDRFLLGAGDTYTAGNTGGAASVDYTPAGSNSGGSVSNHTLTTAQIPSHNHSFTGSAVTSGGISANHTHTGTSGNVSQGHTHTGPSHNHAYSYEKIGDTGTARIICRSYNTSYSDHHTSSDGTGATGGISANHTHTTTTGNQSAGHTHSVTASGSIGNSGSGGAHNHGFTNPTFSGTKATIATMPPYLVVYMWKRTA